MFNASDKPFFHPVTHQLIQPGQFYDGVAHQEFENVPVEAAEPELDIGVENGVKSEQGAGEPGESVEQLENDLTQNEAKGIEGEIVTDAPSGLASDPGPTQDPTSETSKKKK